MGRGRGERDICESCVESGAESWGARIRIPEYFCLMAELKVLFFPPIPTPLPSPIPIPLSLPISIPIPIPATVPL